LYNNNREKYCDIFKISVIIYTSSSKTCLTMMEITFTIVISGVDRKVYRVVTAWNLFIGWK